MKGRKPKPTAIKLVTGNPGRRPLNTREPAVERITVPPPPPEELDELARAEWTRTAPLLMRAGLLSTIDRAAFAGYCQSWSTWTQAMGMIQKTSLLMKSPSGYLMQSPYFGIATTALKQMRAFLAEFGMTPSSRSRIQAESNGNERPADPAEAYFG